MPLPVHVSRLIRRPVYTVFPLIVLLGLGGCASLPSDPVQKQDSSSQAVTTPSLPEGPLTRTQAADWAVAHDPDIRALLLSDELEIVDIRRQGRLGNPGITLARLKRGSETDIERGVDLDILGLLTLPVRQQWSDKALASARLQSRIRLLQRRLQVEQAWIDAVAAAQRARYAADVADTAQAAHELASRMRQAGTLSELDAGREKAFWLESSMALQQALSRARLAREKLALAMGVADPQSLNLPDQLPALPDSLGEGALQKMSLEERLDIQSVRAEAAALAKSLRLGKATRMINVLELGLEANSATGQPVQHGQSLRLELPVFDAGVSRVREADLRYRRALAQAAARALAVQQEWRQAQADQQAAWDTARNYRDELIPLQKKLLDEMLLRYNGMLVDTFELLAQTREQIRTLNDGLDAQAEYWHARIRQEHVRYAPLPSGEQP